MTPHAARTPYYADGSAMIYHAHIVGIGVDNEERWCARAAQRCSQEVLGLVG